MSRETLNTLFHPFEDVLRSPQRGERVLFLGAVPGLRPPSGFGAELTLVQGFRPDFLALGAAGFAVAPIAQGEGYDLVLILAGRHRGQNEQWLAEAVRRARPDGLIVAAGGKTEGIASLRKRVEATVPLDGHCAKYHGNVFWFRRGVAAEDFAGRIAASSEPDLVDGRFETAPGMFSHEHVDAGSRLLAECLPATLTGRVADFCAGWGYLAAEAAARSAKIERIDLYEADHASLAAAERNLARLQPHLESRCFWQDLAAEPVGERYDAIVMNPPFHTGRAAEPGLGQALIGVAAAALRPGGDLFMVSNRQLPYETTLAARFARVDRLREEAGFKLFRARR